MTAKRLRSGPYLDTPHSLDSRGWLLVQFLRNLWKKLTETSTPAAVQESKASKSTTVRPAAANGLARPTAQVIQPSAPAHVTTKQSQTPSTDNQPVGSYRDSKIHPSSAVHNKPPQDEYIAVVGSKIISRSGFSRILGNLIAEGGTSSIYELEGNSDVVCKIFTQDFLKSHGKEAQEKIEFQLSFKDDIEKRLNISWPRTAIYSPHGNWLGYSMKKAKGVPLNRIVHPILMKKYAPDLDRIKLLKILIQIAKGVDLLNSANVFIGDFNPENFLVDLNDYKVTFIDSDGYQIGNFKCLFVKPEYIPPEHLDLAAEDVVRNNMSDSFSLAILLFQSFMMLRHPYDSVGGGDLLENTRGGHFPYGLGGVAPGKDGAIPPGPWYNMWSHLPYAVKNGFIRTLSAGTDHPDDRTLASSWVKLLIGYSSDLKKGYHRHELLPPEAKKPIYRGKDRKGTEVV